MIRVMLADDQRLVRAGFRAILDGEDDIEVVAEAADGAEAVRLVPELAPDVILMDIRMPGVDGLTVIRESRRLKPDIPVIIITGFSTEASSIGAVNLGVSGYLTKLFRVPRVLAAAAKALGE